MCSHLTGGSGLQVTKAVLWGKLKGAQCSETVKSRVPSIWFVWKIWDFLVAREQKLGARGHCIIINMIQWPVFLPSSPEGKLVHLYNGNPLLLFCNHKIGVGRSGIFWVLFFAPFLIFPVTLTWDYPLGFLPYKNGRDACCQLPITPLQDTRTLFCGRESNSFLPLKVTYKLVE